jgi:hypothetical protein
MRKCYLDEHYKTAAALKLTQENVIYHCLVITGLRLLWLNAGYGLIYIVIFTQGLLCGPIGSFLLKEKVVVIFGFFLKTFRHAIICYWVTLANTLLTAAAQ